MSSTPFDHIEALIAEGGEISLGRFGLIPCAVFARNETKSVAVLIRKEEESLPDLLARLDEAIRSGKEGKMIDEVSGDIPEPIPPDAHLR